MKHNSLQSTYYVITTRVWNIILSSGTLCITFIVTRHILYLILNFKYVPHVWIPNPKLINSPQNDAFWWLFINYAISNPRWWITSGHISSHPSLVQWDGGIVSCFIYLFCESVRRLQKLVDIYYWFESTCSTITRGTYYYANRNEPDQ